MPSSTVCSRLFLVLSACVSALAFGVDPTAIEKLSSSPQWHRLMHYRRTFPLHQLRSQLDGSEFFFSPDGHKDPKAEMEASIAGFSKDLKIGLLKQHPQCAFPERYRFLKSELGLKIENVKCEKFEEFLSRFDAESVTLVFSSAYPNNPGSMFGHTFLRLNRKRDEKRDEKKHDILDFGVSFAAGVGEDENPMAFILLGVAGGYKGQFSMLPYYVKVNEYSNAESRDIWEYNLNFTPEETKRLLGHAWELESTSHFAYYFFDENCALLLLQLLETAKPDWDVSQFAIYVIPSETIKRVTETPGAVKSIKFRPSLRKRMIQRFESLNPAQRDQFSSIIANSSPVEKITDPYVLDTVSSYLYYEKQKREGKQSDEEKALQTKALVRRSELGPAPTPDPATLPKISEETQPDLGHYAYRLSLSPGLLQRSGGSFEYFQDLGWKSAYHDLLNKDLGFTRFSQIDFPSINFRYVPARRSFFVENLEFLHITSLFPLGFLEKRFSWKMQLNYYTPKDLGCVDCHTFHFEAGAGATIDLFDEKAVLYALALANVDVGSALRKGYRVGPKLQVATILNPFPDYKMRLAGNLVFDLFQSDRQRQFFLWEWDHALSLSQAWEVRASAFVVQPTSSLGIDYKELKLSLNFYF